ncbi:hypothetical protein MHYP_G00121100 [Metynnis hypsauchen]
MGSFLHCLRNAVSWTSHPRGAWLQSISFNPRHQGTSNNTRHRRHQAEVIVYGGHGPGPHPHPDAPSDAALLVMVC